MPIHPPSPSGFAALGMLLLLSCSRIDPAPAPSSTPTASPRRAPDAMWRRCEEADVHRSEHWVLIRDSAAVPEGTVAAWDLAFAPSKGRWVSHMAGTSERDGVVRFGAFRGAGRINADQTLAVHIATSDRPWAEMRGLVALEFTYSPKAIVFERLPATLTGERCTDAGCRPSQLTFTEQGLSFDQQDAIYPTFEADRLARRPKSREFGVERRALFAITSAANELVACGRF